MTNHQRILKRVDGFFKAMTRQGVFYKISGTCDAFHPEVINNLCDDVERAAFNAPSDRQLKSAVQGILEGLIEDVANKTRDRIKKEFLSKSSMDRLKDSVSYAEYKRILEAILNGK